MKKQLFTLLLLVPLLISAQNRWVLENKDTVVPKTKGVQRTSSYSWTEWVTTYDTLKFNSTGSLPPVTGAVVGNLAFNNPSNIFEGSSLPNSKETFGNWIPKVVNMGGRTGVLQVGVNNTSTDGSRLRNELTQWNVPTLNTHAVYEWAVYFPVGFKTDNNSNNFIQIHNAGKSGAIPNVSFMLKSNMQLDLNLAWQTDPKWNGSPLHNDVHYWFDLSKWIGSWHTIKMEINWFPNSQGYFKLWFDGVPAVSKDGAFRGVHNGPMGYAFDTQGPYFKFGLHYPVGALPTGSTQTSQYVLYDNIIFRK